ncbi:MAG TPA: nucleotidyltransferase [Mycobacterium sp.]|nr:nucleotidyltransferase [Mycobacterium sp.]
MLGRDEQLRSALKIAASALKEHGPRFALAGSFALWVFGAPEPVHDVDFVVAETDAEAAAATLAQAGFAVERTPEDWLFKAHVDDVVVDVLHRVNGVAVDADCLDAAEDHSVLAITMPVLTPTVVLIQKLRSLDEHFCDFSSLLPATRAVRERVDWDRVRADTAENDFAVAFLVLADRLRITG